MPARRREYPPVPHLNFHGKEGVDGSSPSEGLKKGSFVPTASSSTAVGQTLVNLRLNTKPPNGELPHELL